MFLVGIKFAMGYWLGTILLVVLAWSLIEVRAYVGRQLKRRKNYLKSSRTKVGYLLWIRGPMSAPDDDGSLQTYSFRTTIRWGERERQAERREEPHYRY